jgi:hypothetical protein
MPLDSEGREPEEKPEPGEKPGERKPDGPAAGAGKKKLGDKKTAILVVLTAAGVLLAWLSLRKGSASSAPSGQPGSSALDPANYPTGNAGDVAGYNVDAGNGFQEMLSNLSQQIGTLNTTITTANQQAATSGGGLWDPAARGLPRVPTSPHASPGVHSAYFIGGGKLNQHYSLRDEARRLLPASQRNNPDAVEAELRRLVAANPSLRGRTYLLGGHRYRMPA